jgi:hypothetical protein
MLSLLFKTSAKPVHSITSTREAKMSPDELEMEEAREAAHEAAKEAAEEEAKEAAEEAAKEAGEEAAKEAYEEAAKEAYDEAYAEAYNDVYADATRLTGRPSKKSKRRRWISKSRGPGWPLLPFRGLAHACWPSIRAMILISPDACRWALKWHPRRYP